MNRDGLGSGMAIVPPPKTGAQQSAQNTKRTLIGPVNKIHTVWDIQRLYNISCLVSEIVSYWRRRRMQPDLVPKTSQVIYYPARLFETLEIPIIQHGSKVIWDIQKLRCTGYRQFRDTIPRGDWVWVRMADSSKYGILRGHLPGKLKALFTVRLGGEDQELALVEMMEVEKNGRPWKSHGLVTVLEHSDEYSRSIFVVSIRSLVAMAHLVQDREMSSRWYINSRIDLWTFNQFGSER